MARVRARIMTSVNILGLTKLRLVVSHIVFVILEHVSNYFLDIKKCKSGSQRV